MEYDEDKAGLKFNAFELAVADLVVDGHLVEQHREAGNVIEMGS